MIDVGTGDGRFVLAEARARPGVLVVGIDAMAEAMSDASRRAGAKPSRGGVGNAVFVCAPAEELPGLLAGLADEITVNYPWGSLLRALALPDTGVLAGLARLGKPGARFTGAINVQPLRDEAQAERIGLTKAALLHDPTGFADAYASAGLDLRRTNRVSEDTAPATSWGRHLAVSKRELLKIEARVMPARDF